MSYKNLFQPLALNDSLELKNRIIMAPLTRCFADENLVPTQEMADYYAKRADAGLIVSEATLITPSAQGYPNTPGIYSSEQISGWKTVTDAVHKNGGKIFCQIWHTGRISHRIYINEQTVSASAVPMSGSVPRLENTEYETPRELKKSEIKDLVQTFVTAAKNAVEAGFDGVEIHGANGYLIDQFLHQHTNIRLDEYGGSIEKRAKFALEVTDAVMEAIGSDRTAIRLSPNAHHFMEHTNEDEKTFIFLLKELEKRKVAYIHEGAFDDNIEYEYLGGRTSDFLRRHYKNNIIACGSIPAKEADEDIMNNRYDLIGIGRPFIANHDYVSKLQNNELLNSYEEVMLGKLT